MPSYGSIVSKELGASSRVCRLTPPCHPRIAFGGGVSGRGHNPFETMGDPGNEKFQVRNLALPGRHLRSTGSNIAALLRSFDSIRRDADASGMIKGMEHLLKKSLRLVTSPAVQNAFDMNREDPQMRDRYGRNNWGQNMLAGPAAGRGGRPVRHGRHGRLGHARQQFRDPQEPASCRSSIAASPP